MKKIFLAIVLSTLPALALAVQTPVTTIDKFNSSTTSINNLREATNTKLGVIESNRQDHVTNIAGKADKSATVMLWSGWADGVSFTTTSPPVAYNGAIYKCVAPYTKVAGETPDTQTGYFAEVTGSGGTGDIEGVTAGTGLSGGGTSGSVTLSADTTYLQRRVSSTCSAGSSIREIATDGTVTCEIDDTGSGSVPAGTVNGQVLIWTTDQWVASTAPWLTTASLGTGVATALGFAPDTAGGFLAYSTYAADPLITWDSATITETVNSPTAGTNTIGVKAGVFQAYDANMILWPSAISATEVGYLDGLGGALTTLLGAKRSIADERKEIGWVIKDSDVVTAVADGKQAAVIPASMNGMVLVDFTCSVSNLNSAASGNTTVVLRRVRGATAVDMTSTGVTIAYTDYTASDEVVDTTNDDVATGDKIFVDVNDVTSPVQKGLGCTAVFANP